MISTYTYIQTIFTSGQDEITETRFILQPKIVKIDKINYTTFFNTVDVSQKKQRDP